MNGWENARLAEAHADLILGDEACAKAYELHFEAQLRAGRLRRLVRAGCECLLRAGRWLAGFDPQGATAAWQY